VVGVEVKEEMAEQAKLHMDRVFIGNVEEIELPYPPSYFDCIIYADILEHLIDPWGLLSRQRALLREGGIVVSSIPNVGFHEIVGNLLLGNWEYREMGILDSTHLRFFTQKEIKRLFRTAGYKIIQLLGSQFPRAPYWLSTWKRERMDEKLKEIVRLFSFNTVNKEFKEEDLKNFLIFQYLIKAKKDDSV
jgi:2-polyprenyl-3-methyl-5-hydroxy-6-metoxy-1,4-benzoquinol methylase